MYKYFACIPGGQKRASDPLHLELQMVVSHLTMLVYGIELGSSGRTEIVLNH